jgi:hypothetical protein
MLWVYSPSMSHYTGLSFSDEEVIAVYLFGVMGKHRTIKGLYDDADRHLRPCWKPSNKSRRPQA